MSKDDTTKQPMQPSTENLTGANHERPSRISDQILENTWEYADPCRDFGMSLSGIVRIKPTGRGQGGGGDTTSGGQSGDSE